MSYAIKRMYQDDHAPEIVERGLTLEEAKEWCSDHETSSRTCTSAEGIARTEAKGAWFDGYVDDNDDNDAWSF